MNIQQSSSAEITKWDHIVSLVWCYFMLFPTGQLFNISIIFILLLLTSPKTSNRRITYGLIFFVILSYFMNFSRPYMDTKAITRIISYIVIFYSFASTKGSRIYYPYILIAGIYVLLSQVSIMFNLPILAGFFDNTYHISSSMFDLYHQNTEDLSINDIQSGSRLGGIFINPNNCASYVSVIYAVGLCESFHLSANKRGKFVFALIAIVFLSFICTGSRTALIFFVIVTLLYFKSTGKQITKYLLFLAFAAILFIIMSNVPGLRMFNIQEGMHGSFSTKLDLFTQYLSNCDNIIYLLFGGGSTAAIGDVLNNTRIDTCDFDLGNIFIAFGPFFYIAYIIFYVNVYKRLRSEYRIILIVLLWMFSNSILVSYRMCPVWFLSLGILYKESVSRMTYDISLKD